nr:MAG TPA: nuclease [Bacteriophage sp.]
MSKSLKKRRAEAQGNYKESLYGKSVGSTIEQSDEDRAEEASSLEKRRAAAQANYNQYREIYESGAVTREKAVEAGRKRQAQWVQDYSTSKADDQTARFRFKQRGAAKTSSDTPNYGTLMSKQLGLTKRGGNLTRLQKQGNLTDYAKEAERYQQDYSDYEDYLSKYTDLFTGKGAQKLLDDAEQELSDQYQRSSVQNAVSRYGQYIPEQYQKQVRDYAAGASKDRQSELLGTIDQASSRISSLDSAAERERLLGLNLDLLKERITVKKRQQTEQLRRYTKEHGYAGNITFDELDADLNAEIEQLQAEYDKAYNLQWRRDQSSKYNALSQNADYAGNTGYRPELARRDTAYAAINGDQQHRQGNSGKGITLIDNEDKYDYLSEDERSTYNYLYNTQGYQAAEDYLDYLSYDLNERRQSAKYKATSDFAGKNVGAGIISSALSVPANLASGIGAIDIGIQRAANAESGRPVDFNSAWQDPYYYTNTVRSTISNNLDTKYGTLSDSIPVIGGQGLGFLYQTGMSMADSAAIAGLTMATGIPEVAGTSLLGGSAAVSSMHDAHNNGLSDGQAIATGVLAGIAETAFEYISLDKLMAKPALVGGTKATQFKNWLVQTAKQAGVEGSEEFFTTAANLLSDFIVNGDQSDIKSTYQQYLNQGYSASEAAARTFGDELSGAVLDFAGGFISGGVMGGVKMGTSAIQNARANTDVSTGRQIIRADNVHRLLILADRLQENGEIYQLVSEQARQENPNYNAAQVGQLAQAVEQSPQSAAIQERLSALGVTEGATELSDAIYRRANAKSMTEEQEQLLESNKSARQVAEELTQAVRGKKTEDNGWAHDAVNVTRGARSYRSKMPDEDVRFRDAVVDRSVGLSAQAETQAQIKESETPVTITGIKRTAMKDGGLSVIVKDESGNTSAVKLQELTRLPGPTHTLIQEALRYGPDASIMFATYSDGQTVGRYADTWAAGYEAGVRGQEMPSPSYEGYNTAMQMAYETGKSRAAADLETRKRGNVQEGRQKTQSKAERVKRTENRAKGKTPASGTVSYDGGTLTAGDVTYRLRSVDRNAMDSYQKQAASAVEMLVKAGVVKRAVFFESDVKNGKFEAFNGAYQDGTIYVDINAGKTKPGDHRRVILQTFAHELTHSLENTEAYGELSRFVLEHIGENQLDEIKTRLTDTGLYSESELDHEIVANACAEVLYDSEAVRALAKENRTLFERVRDFIHDLIQKIRDVYKRENSFRQESILMRDVTDQLAELWDSALLEKVGTSDDLSSVEQEEFSMREPVEETKDLLALHNLTEENLRDVLKLGGFPMPSVAIVKAEQGHSKYGPISLVLPRASIDPETDARNHIFGADAYTPTAPEVEYPVNYDRLLEVERTLNNLSKNVANGIFANSSLIRSLGIDDSSSMSVDQLAEKLAGRDTVQAAYLADHGKTVAPVLSDKVWNKYGNDLLQTLVDQIGEQRLAEINANFALGMQASESLGPDAETIRDQLREYYRKAGEAFLQRMAKRNGWSQDEIEAKRQSRIDRSMENNVSMFTLEQIARNAWDMYLDKGKTKGEVDRMATLDALREQVNHSDVKEWLQGKLSGLLGEPGIYNGKERYTPSGNSRSFSQLHYAYTAENIVRAMTEAQKQRGEKVFAPNSTALMSTATPEYGSISDVKQDSGRLQTVDDQEYKDLLDEIDDSIGNVITKVRQQNEPHSDNSFEEMDIIGSILVSSATGKHTPVAIIRAFAKEGYTIDKDTARMIQALYHSAAQMPTGYFEAKPERVVQYNEALAVVVPENMDSELMKQVTAAGMPVRTYAAGDEQSRLEAINSVEGAKFSYREDAVQKDEIETGIRIAAQSKAVTSVSAYAGSLKASDVVKAVGDFFDSVGGTVENPQLGDVTLGRRGIKSDLAHGVGRNKVAAFMAVPSILERGNVVDYQVNWKGRGYDTAVVAAPIQIEGVAYLAGVLLKRSNSVNRFYVHEVLTIEEGTALFNQAALQNEDVDSGSDVPSMNSILQRVLDVKNQISAAEHTAEAGDDEIAQRIALEQSGAEFSARVYEQTDDEILSALDTSSLHTQAEREAYFRWERRRAQYQNWQNTVDELRRQYDAVEDKSSSEARNLAARVRAFTAQIDNAIQRSDEALSGSKALQDVLSRERADMLVKDIRGNLSEEQRQALYRLNREARSLRRRLAELQRQGTVTTAESAQINQSDLKRFASALTQGTSIGSSSIMYELSNLTSAIMQGGSIGDQLLGWNEMYDMANSIADKVVSAYQLDISEIDDRYADIIGKTMTVPASIRSDVRAEGLDVMARNAGIRLKFTDDTHSGLEDFVAQTPGVADESAPLVTQLGDIVYSVLALQQTAADQIDVRQETESLAQTILDGVMDIAQQHTTADRAQAKRENAIQRERTKAEQKLEHTTEKYEAKLQKAKKKLVETRKSMQEKATQRVREARQKQHLLDMTEKKRQDVARRERSAARGLRDKILRHASDMSRKLLHPSDKQHIPEQLRISVAAVLDAINLTSKKDVESSADLTKRTQAFEAAREAYQQILQENNGEMVVDPSLVGENGDGYFDQLIALRNTPIAKMNNQQLQLVWDTLKAVEASIQNAGKALSDAKYQRISQWADAFRTDTASRKVKKTITKSHFMLDMETPLTFFSHFGAAGDAVYRMLRDAQDRQQVMVDEVAADVQQLMGDNPLKTLREAKKDIKTFRFADGELTLSADQRMEVYLLMQRQQAQEHLLIGGIVQPEVTYAKRTIRRGNRAVHMSLDELSQITSALTADQIKLADGLQAIMSGRLSDYGNQASMQAYGYQKFREKNYWPIKTASEETHSSVEKGGDNTISVKNFGMAKSTVAHANNGVDLSGVFDTFARHASEMTTYAAWLCPMEDAGRLYNWKYSEYNDDGVRQTTGTIKGVLNDVGGSGAANYWMNLMADIQSGIGDTKDSAMGSIPAKLLGNAKGAAVGANLRVVIQQPTALFRAMALWSPADLMRGLAGGATRGGGFKRAERYSPIAARKAQGGFDISSGNQMQEILYGDSSRLKRISNALSWGAGKADEITWGYLWNCAERKVQKESNLDVGTDAFYAEVNRRFTEMIDATQVVDGVLQRSQVMRSSNAWNKMATAFMGEPTMSFNVMMRAVDQFLYESDGAKRGKAVGKILRGASALLVTAAVNGVMKSLIDAVRDDDKDKDFWDRFIAAFSGVDGTEANAFQRMFNIMFSGNMIGDVNPLMQLPYVKDVISVMQGYDVGRMDMDAVSELVDCGKNVMNALQGDSNKTLAYTLEKLAAKIADLSGISVNNITRDMWSLLRTVVSGQGNYYVEYQMEKAIYDLSSDKNKSRYMEILMRAYLNDSDAYSAIERDILDSGVYTGKDIGDYMMNYWKDGVKAASDDLDLEEQDRLKEQMIESGFMSEDDADGYLTKYRLLLENPDFDGDITTQQAEKYYDIAEPAGIDLSVFYALTQQYSAAENEKDAEGKDIEGKTKKDKVMAWINSQSLSSSQKDTLYLVYYKESTLSDAPWH